MRRCYFIFFATSGRIRVQGGATYVRDGKGRSPVGRCSAEDATEYLSGFATVDQPKNGKYTSKAELRKNMRIMRNGPGWYNTQVEELKSVKDFCLTALIGFFLTLLVLLLV
ncbi:hypothetical protein OROMI_017749 [Orobanche minor]